MGEPAYDYSDDDLPAEWGRRHSGSLGNRRSRGEAIEAGADTGLAAVAAGILVFFWDEDYS